MAATIENLPAGAIHQRAGGQDRQGFGELEELAASIRENGLASPPVVRPAGDAWEIVAGERRVRAMRDVLGWAEIPCIVRELTDEAASRIMLIENVQRVDLDPLEEATAYAERAERFGWSAAEIARTCGIPAQRVRDRLRLLELTEELRHYVSRKVLPLGYALAVASLDPNRQHLGLVAFEEHHPSLPAFRELCTRLADDQAAEAADGMFDPDAFLRLEEWVREAEATVAPAEVEIVREAVLGPAEIAERFKVKASTVAQWRQRDLFPPPDLRISGRDLWYEATVETWAVDTGRAEQLTLA